jgi:hypothetical protein
MPRCVQVITTRTYDDRLDTISHVRDAGISVCSGGILGLGESDADRVGLIWEASKCVPSFTRVGYILQDEYSMPEHPESFPVNALVPIKGTPLENNEVSNQSDAPASSKRYASEHCFVACFSSRTSPYDRHFKNSSSDDDHQTRSG